MRYPCDQADTSLCFWMHHQPASSHYFRCHISWAGWNNKPEWMTKKNPKIKYILINPHGNSLMQKAENQAWAQDNTVQDLMLCCSENLLVVHLLILHFFMYFSPPDFYNMAPSLDLWTISHFSTAPICRWIVTRECILANTRKWNCPPGCWAQW